MFNIFFCTIDRHNGHEIVDENFKLNFIDVFRLLLLIKEIKVSRKTNLGRIYRVFNSKQIRLQLAQLICFEKFIFLLNYLGKQITCKIFRTNIYSRNKSMVKGR